MTYIVAILVLCLVIALLVFAKPFKGKAYPDLVVDSLPTMLDFYTDTCPACQQMAPIVDVLEAQYKGKVSVRRVNASTEPDLAKRFNVMYVPTYVFLDVTGRVREKQVGGNPSKLADAFADAAGR